MAFGDRFVENEFAPTADVVVYKTDSKVVAKAWDKNHERWKRIAQGRAGTSVDDDAGDDTVVLKSGMDHIKKCGGGRIYLVKSIYYIRSGNIEFCDNMLFTGNNSLIYFVPDEIFNINIDINGSTAVFKSLILADKINNLIIKNIRFKIPSSFLESFSSSRGLVFTRITDFTFDNCIVDGCIAGQMFVYGSPSENTWCDRIYILNSRFLNYTSSTSIDTTLKFFGCKYLVLKNLYNDSSASNGDILFKGHNYNLDTVLYSVIDTCYGRAAKAGVWIDSTYNYNTYSFISNCKFEDESYVGISGVAGDRIVSNCTINNVYGLGINADYIINSIVSNWALSTSVATPAISGKSAINCKVLYNSDTNSVYARGYDCERVISCESVLSTINTFAIDTTRSNMLIEGCSFDTTINLRYCYGVRIVNSIVPTVRIVGGGNHIIKNCIFTGTDGIVWAGSIPIGLVIKSNNLSIPTLKISTEIAQHAYNVSDNIGFDNKSFLLTGKDVTLGSGAYGDAVIIQSLAGFISNFDLVLHITAAAGDTVNAKVTTVFENAGETIGVIKTLDNSSGTASKSADITLDVADKLALWVDNDRLLQIKVYGESATGAAGSSLTFDVFGSS